MTDACTCGVDVAHDGAHLPDCPAFVPGDYEPDRITEIRERYQDQDTEDL